MAGTTLQTPYATAMPYVASASAGWSPDEYNRQRLLTYNFYDDLFHNDPTQFKFMLRGSDEKPVLIPTASSLIKSLTRYVGKNWGFRIAMPEETDGTEPVDETAEVATPEQINQAIVEYGKLFKRERLEARYAAGIPEWLRRGDWLWFVSADPLKKEGSRISVRPIDPRRYFPINGDARDLSRVTGQQLIEEVLLADGKTIAIFAQTWRKSSDPLHPNFGQPETDEGFDITYEAQAYDVKDFGDPLKEKKLAFDLNLPIAYVPGITQLPIYHIKNNEETDDPFGRSELAGLESVLAGINQAASDEDISLAFMGIGMYWTNSGAPVDERTGQPGNWKLGPKRVVEVDENSTFAKVDGIDDVTPFQDHLKFLKGSASDNMGLSAVSIGTGEVTVASGISLAIQFSPTADAVKGKNRASNGVLTQMLWDLKSWFKAFEGIDLGPVEIESVTDDDNLLPFDREGRFKEIVEGITAGIFTPEFAVKLMEEEFGYTFPADYLTKLAEVSAAKAAAADPLGARVDAEMAATDEPTEES